MVKVYGENSWHRLCRFMPNKTEIRCFKRWRKLNGQDGEGSDAESDDQPTKSNQWTQEEDDLLR